MDIWESAGAKGPFILNEKEMYGDLSTPRLLEAESAAKKNLTPNGRVTCWRKRYILKKEDRKTRRICKELNNEGLIKLYDTAKREIEEKKIQS